MAEKYVVLFSQVQHVYHRGDVVAATDLRDVHRLLDQQAIRPATADEAMLERVALDLPGRLPASIDGRLAEKDREIARLLLRVRELEEQLSAARAKIGLPPDVEVVKLRARVEELEGEAEQQRALLQEATLARRPRR